MQPRRAHIYRSPRHLLATFAFVVAPFLFFLAFTRIFRLTSVALFRDLSASIGRLLVAYLCSVVLAWLLGVICSRGRRAAIALPLFDVLQSFPMFALLPFIVSIWGPSNIVVVATLVVTIIWPILFSIVSSLKLLRSDWHDVVRITGLHGLPYFRSFLWPVTVPGLVTGSIIGIGEGWEALIATELIVGVPTGLGGFFSGFAHDGQITAFGILGFLVLIFAVNKLLWLPLLERSHRMMGE